MLLLGVGLLFSAARSSSSIVLNWAQNSSGRAFDGIGAVSGGGATSTFLLAYKEPQRSQILDWLFLPNFGASLNILKVELGADDQVSTATVPRSSCGPSHACCLPDDGWLPARHMHVVCQTTDGSEASHMRSQGEVDCYRGYEWELMKEATRRNPHITIYGLPWAWPGFLGFGTNDPYTNVTATAEYTVTWIECARDAHALNVSFIGLWNEESYTLEYILALRARLDAGGLRHVRIIAPDGGGSGIDEVARAMAANESVNAATWGLGAHYPGAAGTSDYVRAAGVPLWAAEDYSTYSDATGCPGLCH
jgi:galactosylceramidase